MLGPTLFFFCLTAFQAISQSHGKKGAVHYCIGKQY